MRITLSQSNSQKFQFLVTGDEPVAFRLLVRSDALTLSYGRLFEAKGRWPPSGSNEPMQFNRLNSFQKSPVAQWYIVECLDW